MFCVEAAALFPRGLLPRSELRLKLKLFIWSKWSVYAEIHDGLHALLLNSLISAQKNLITLI